MSSPWRARPGPYSVSTWSICRTLLVLFNHMCVRLYYGWIDVAWKWPGSNNAPHGLSWHPYPCVEPIARVSQFTTRTILCSRHCRYDNNINGVILLLYHSLMIKYMFCLHFYQCIGYTAFRIHASGQSPSVIASNWLPSTCTGQTCGVNCICVWCGNVFSLSFFHVNHAESLHMTTKRLPVSHSVPLLSSDLPADTLSFFYFFFSIFSVGIFSTVLWRHALPQESLLLYLTWGNTFLIVLIYAATFPLAPRSLPHSQFTPLLPLQYSTFGLYKFEWRVTIAT